MIEILVIIFSGLLLFYLALRDNKTREVKDLHIIPLLLFALLFAFLTSTLYLTVLSFILMFIICLLLFRLGMGGGDLKIMLILTIMLNIKAFYILALAGIIYLLFNLKKKSTKAFVPYIFLSYTIISILYFCGVF